ncbi:MAG: hypothetical protein ACTSP3_03360 [Candidatus Heimdallarchaeaceae archaeon]
MSEIAFKLVYKRILKKVAEFASNNKKEPLAWFSVIFALLAVPNVIFVIEETTRLSFLIYLNYQDLIILSFSIIFCILIFVFQRFEKRLLIPWIFFFLGIVKIYYSTWYAVLGFSRNVSFSVFFIINSIPSFLFLFSFILFFVLLKKNTEYRSRYIYIMSFVQLILIGTFIYFIVIKQSKKVFYQYEAIGLQIALTIDAILLATSFISLKKFIQTPYKLPLILLFIGILMWSSSRLIAIILFHLFPSIKLGDAGYIFGTIFRSISVYFFALSPMAAEYLNRKFRKDELQEIQIKESLESDLDKNNLYR